MNRMRRRLRQQLPLQEDPVRNRLGTAAVAALLAAVASVTLASASSPRTNGSEVAAAQVTPLTIAPIQQLSLEQDGDASTRTTAQVVDKVGQVPGFCRLHS
jgi:hypothetical protein